MGMKSVSQYIFCICEHGNLTKAAKEIGISQPALSTAVNNLEKKLGFKIFDRSQTPLCLTTEGEMYVEYLGKKIILERDFQKKVKEFHDIRGGKLVIGAPAVYIDSILINAVSSLCNIFPDYDITIKSDQIFALVEEIEKGNIDGFISTSNILSEKLEAVEIKSERIYLCIPKDWEINKQIAKEINNSFDYSILNGMEFIFLEKHLPLQKRIEKFLANNKVTLKSSLYVNQVSTGVALSGVGLGICFASGEAIASSKYQDKLCKYILPNEVSERKIYFIYHKERYLTRVSKELIKILQEDGKCETKK